MNRPYFLPEWTPLKAVLLAWPYPHGDWRNNFAEVQACYWHLLSALSQHVDVWLVLHPCLAEDEWRASMPELSVAWHRVIVHNDLAYNDTWARDYGPLSLSHGYLSLQFNGWGGKYAAELDNSLAERLLPRHGLGLEKLSFVGEGGALETNGQVLLANEDCVVDELRNEGVDKTQAEAYLSRTLGVKRVQWLKGINLTNDDTDGHIDTIARFVDDAVVVYSGRNATHPDAVVLESLHQQLQAIATEEAWQLFELPTPQIASRIDGRILPATYANFLIANDALFVPVYGVDEDRSALQVLARACPQYRLVPVRCEALLEQHGSLHCATMQIARLSLPA